MQFVAFFRRPKLLRIGLVAGAFFFLKLLALPKTISHGQAAKGVGGVFAGQPRIVDGDTLDVGAVRVRLEGIDAPEASQTCEDANGGTWACGSQATAALRAFTDAGDVMCDKTGIDIYGRVLAECYDGGVNINAAMVSAGWAWAFVRYSTEFSRLEAEARAAKVGVWQGPAQAPWDYRRREWQVAAKAAPSGCAIKGNVSPRGAVYHLPWSRDYGQIRIEEGRGERWFCSEAEALAAGWRPPPQN